VTEQVEHLFQAALALPHEEQLQLIAALTAAAEEQGLRPLSDTPGWTKSSAAPRHMTPAGSLRFPGPRSNAGRASMGEVVFLPGADQDYRDAWRWYRERSAHAAGFEAAVDVALRKIAQAPATWPRCDERHQFYILRKYP
jgi:hypothetical protein